MFKSIVSKCMFFGALFALVGLSDKTLAQKTALVIGNENYASVPIPQAVKEARKLVALLESNGFEVLYAYDVDRPKIRRKVRRFSDLAKKNNSEIFFYYVGHAVQYKNSNYLIPLDADIEEYEEIPDYGFNFNSILELFESNNQAKAFILHASFGNPFSSIFNAPAGLYPADGPDNSFIGFSSRPGTLSTHQSNFGELFVRQISDDRNLDIDNMFKQIRKVMFEKTNDQVVAWQSSSLRDEFYFRENRRRESKQNTDNYTEEDKAWIGIKHSKDVDILKNFAERYPSSNYTQIANIAVSRKLEYNLSTTRWIEEFDDGCTNTD